ncbi:hypothetical protein ACIBEJ_10295 [Nonomuraea sp. NPDC050790]|uniref:hypothetical protein n=1 Tax=Nonomuraea sp. NPDC050790 TaxID=3364371 RepID=UPI0037B31B20
MLRRSFGLVLASVLTLAIGLFSTPAHAVPPGSDWAYQQIVSRQIPIQPDGKPTYFMWGRYYTGPNGLEIRLNRDGTWNTILTVAGLSSGTMGLAATGKALTFSEVAVSALTPTKIKAAAGIAGIVGGHWANDMAKDAVLRNLCMGITIPPGGISVTLDRAAALASGNLNYMVSAPYYNHIRVWFERC